MTLQELQSADSWATYAVDGYGGVAFKFRGFQIEWHEEWHDGCYTPEMLEEPTGMVYMVMVGDDHKHVIDPEDISILDEDAYCHVCGQIGCTHDGR